MDRFDAGMPDDIWKKVREQAGQVLGQSFWNDLGRIIPKRTMPPCDMFRWNEELIVIAEAPGLQSSEDIKLAITGRELHLRGNRERIFPVTEESQLLAECSYGPFHRVVELPADVMPDTLSAQYRHGLLVIRMGLAIVEETPIQIDFQAKGDGGSGAE